MLLNGRLKIILACHRFASGDKGMHFIVAWNIAAQEPKRSEIEKALIASISGYSWVRALPFLFVVKVNSQLVSDVIRGRMIAVGERYTPVVNFILSPVTSGGSYKGFLPKDLWPKIEELTK